MLNDGTVLNLRPIQPSDKDALAEGFAQLSLESRRRRFFTLRKVLSDDELRYFTECDGENHYAIVAARGAATDGQQEGIGVARFIRLKDDPVVAEVAIVVADAWQRRGVGKRLLERIVAAAAERGIQKIHAIALPDNDQIRGLLENLAENVETGREYGVLTFSFPTVAPDRPDALDSLFAALRLAALGAIIVPVRFGRITLRQLRRVNRPRDRKREP